MKNKLYVLTALCLPFMAQGMEEQPGRFGQFPYELQFHIASCIENINIADTIKEIVNLRLVNQTWNNVALDEQLLPTVLEKCGQKAAQYGNKSIKSYKASLGYVLIAAAKNNMLPLMAQLLDAGADASVQAKTPDKQTALLAALKAGHREAAKLILEKADDVNVRARTQSGKTALEKVTQNNDIELVKMLLAKGADARNVSFVFSGIRPKSALKRAQELGYQELVKILQSSKPPVCVKHVHNFSGRKFTLTVVSAQGEIKKRYTIKHSPQEIDVFLKNERIVTEPPRTVVDINLTQSDDNTYDSIIVTGEGLPADGWKYTPSGSCLLLGLGIRIEGGNSIINKIDSRGSEAYFI